MHCNFKTQKQVKNPVKNDRGRKNPKIDLLPKSQTVKKV